MMTYKLLDILSVLPNIPPQYIREEYLQNLVEIPELVTQVSEDEEQ